MTVKDLHKAFQIEFPNIAIIENGKYTQNYVQWLEKKLTDFLTS